MRFELSQLELFVPPSVHALINSSKCGPPPPLSDIDELRRSNLNITSSDVDNFESKILFIKSVVASCICAFGIVGNLLTLLVLSRKRLTVSIKSAHTSCPFTKATHRKYQICSHFLSFHESDSP